MSWNVSTVNGFLYRVTQSYSGDGFKSFGIALIVCPLAADIAGEHMDNTAQMIYRTNGTLYWQN